MEYSGVPCTTKRETACSLFNKSLYSRSGKGRKGKVYLLHLLQAPSCSLAYDGTEKCHLVHTEMVSQSVFHYCCSPLNSQLLKSTGKDFKNMEPTRLSYSAQPAESNPFAQFGPWGY